jgi:hypothetical protein
VLGPQSTIGHRKKAHPRLAEQANGNPLDIVLAHFHSNLRKYDGTQVLTLAFKLDQVPNNKAQR